jgi:hypothetical protein
LFPLSDGSVVRSDAFFGTGVLYSVHCLNHSNRVVELLLLFIVYDV